MCVTLCQSWWHWGHVTCFTMTALSSPLGPTQGTGSSQGLDFRPPWAGRTAGATGGCFSSCSHSVRAALLQPAPERPGAGALQAASSVAGREPVVSVFWTGCFYVWGEKHRKLILQCCGYTSCNTKTLKKKKKEKKSNLEVLVESRKRWLWLFFTVPYNFLLKLVYFSRSTPKSYPLSEYTQWANAK